MLNKSRALKNAAQTRTRCVFLGVKLRGAAPCLHHSQYRTRTAILIRKNSDTKVSQMRVHTGTRHPDWTIKKNAFRNARTHREKLDPALVCSSQYTCMSRRLFSLEVITPRQRRGEEKETEMNVNGMRNIASPDRFLYSRNLSQPTSPGLPAKKASIIQ